MDVEELTALDRSGDETPPLRRHRLWLLASVAGIALVGSGLGVWGVVQGVERQRAVEVFEGAVADRSAAYGAQADAVGELHAAEAVLTVEYPLYVAIASTLTDSTVADPAARAELLSKAAEYADADLALDGSGAFVADRPPILDELVPAESAAVSEFATDDLVAQAAELTADAASVRSYIDLVEATTEEITSSAAAAAASLDAVLASAAEKGVTLTWEKAPAETAAVVAAAQALVPGEGTNRSLAEEADLVTAYIAAVNAAGAAHQAVLDREAEAARQAAAEEAERQAAAQRQQWNTQGNRNGGGGPSNQGSSGGGRPSAPSPGLPSLGGDIGDGIDRNNGQCWTSNGAGGTMPCGGW